MKSVLKTCQYFLFVVLVLSVTACATDDGDSTGTGAVIPSFAYNVSTQRATMRMSAGATQQEGSSFLGIKDQRFYPFATEGKIEKDDAILGTPISDLNRYTTTYHYYATGGYDIPSGTSSFLCYCSADGHIDDFTSGAVDATFPAELTGKKASDISFSPKKIHSDVTTADGKATDIADYLTDMAKAIPDNNKELFNQFINYGHIIPASSNYVEGLKSWMTLEEIPLPTTDKDISGYPANINLPDGAAVVKWNTTSKKFEPVLQTTTQANINSLNRFVYPAGLYYYANSRIKTSSSSHLDSYEEPWDAILALHEVDNATIQGDETSVAVKEALQYAVGCLQLEINATIDDPENYQLTGVFIGSQYSQRFDFTANTDADECIIYDKSINVEFTMASELKNYTLVFQTPDSRDVPFALEFKNNSGADFEGIEMTDLDGHTLKNTVYNGTKFYLVGTLKLATPTAEDFTQRVFTKDYITKGTVNITSLSQAHTYLPDLLDPRLEVGIVVETKWIPATPTNVPL